jgi:hypothetical protein
MAPSDNYDFRPGFIVHGVRRKVDPGIPHVPVTVVPSYRYLGLTLYATENPFKGTSALAQGARRALFALTSRCRALGIRDFPTLTSLYDTFVRPILLYASEVWLPYIPVYSQPDYHDVKKWHTACPLGESLHSQFLRFALRLRPSTPLAALYHETGRYPNAIEGITRLLKYTSRLQRLAEVAPDRPLAAAFQRAVTTAALPGEKGAGSWGSNTLALLHTRCNHPATSLGPELPTRALLDACHRMFELGVLRRALTSGGTKHTDYLTLDAPFGPQPYLLHSYSPCARNLLCALRLGSHDLAVETGRWTQQARGDRKCPFCLARLGVEVAPVEDVPHFLFSCPTLAEARKPPPALPNHSLDRRPHQPPGMFPDNPPDPATATAALLGTEHFDALGAFLIRARTARAVLPIALPPPALLVP